MSVILFILASTNYRELKTNPKKYIKREMSKLNVENQNLSSENLQNIQWSETSIPLCDFVTTYPLPQIVQIEEGYHGGSDENSLSMGQVLKIHTLTTERKLLCQDRHSKELHVPVHTQKVYLKPENYETVYQRVQDLSHAKPLPKFVEVTRGYFDVDSEVDYELSVDPGEILEVIEVNESNIFTKKARSMTFRNSEGIVLKIPFDCVAGFKPLVDNTPRMLSECIPSESNSYKYPFHFQFHGSQTSKVGVMKVKSAYDDHLIIASCGQGRSQVVFMIPQNLKVKVKVAVGTLKEDPEYENIRRSYHNFQSLESDLQKSQSFRGRMSSNASEIVGIPIVKQNGNSQQHPLNWVTFDPDDNETNGANGTNGDVGYCESSKRKSVSETNGIHGAHAHVNGQALTPTFDRKQSLSSSGHIKRPSLINDHMGAQPQPRSISPVIQGNGNGDFDKYKEIREMSVCQLADCLRSLNMNKHAENFSENQIDGELFLCLEEDELKDLELTKFEMKKLQRFKDGWRPKLE